MHVKELFSKLQSEHYFCLPATNYFTQANWSSNQEYYANTIEPGYFMYGVAERQPTLALEKLLALSATLNVDGVDVNTLNRYRVAINQEATRIDLNRQLYMFRMGPRAVDKELNNVITNILRWRLGKKFAFKKPQLLKGVKPNEFMRKMSLSNDSVGMKAFRIVHAIEMYLLKKGDSKAKENIMAWIRTQIPYEIWAQGL